MNKRLNKAIAIIDHLPQAGKPTMESRRALLKRHGDFIRRVVLAQSGIDHKTWEEVLRVHGLKQTPVSYWLIQDI